MTGIGAVAAAALLVGWAAFSVWLLFYSNPHDPEKED